MALIFEDLKNGAGKHDSVIKQGTMQSFKSDVMEESKKRIVFAYFQSAKNPKCEQFAQLLEKYIRLSNGKAVLVKFNIEECQSLAIQLGIQGVPTTMIFAQGGLADGFAGVVPESQLKSFMQALIGKAALSLDEMLKDAAEKLAQGQAQEALEEYAAVLEKDEANPSAFAGMIRCFIDLKQFDAAKDLADGLEDSIKSQDLQAAKIALKLALESQNAPELDEIKGKLLQTPEDLQLHYDYARALFAKGHPQEAIDQLIFIIKKEQNWNNDAARQQLFQIFSALGQTNPVTVAGRRKLSSFLFS